MFRWLIDLYEEWKFSREFEKKKKELDKSKILLYYEIPDADKKN